MALEEIRSERVKKIALLQEQKMESYPALTSRTHLVGEVLKKFSALAKTKKKIKIAGRVTAKREHGGSTFVDLTDATGKIQSYFKEDVLKEGYDLLSKTADVGDFIEAEGKLFKTKRGEPTLEVTNWSMLAKSLRPLPEKWHGLQDVEERFRKRYLDLLMNEEVRRRFETRSKIISSIRDLFIKQGFLEVETPMLQPLAGGALARPFITHHNALDIDLYLRIAPELYLKRLLVGGFEKIFEIGKNFRNEGIDVSHNPEFTMLESYAAYWDENQMMSFMEEMFLFLAKNFGAALSAVNNHAKRGKKQTIEFGGQKITFKKPFPHIAFKELLKRYAQVIDYDGETRDSLAVRAKQLGIDVGSHESKGKIADEIYKKICRPHLSEPTFVINHPLDISPLAKKRPGNENEVRRFQLIAGGQELANGFSELNDPLDQRTRFEEQERERSGGEEEAHRIDEEFLEAMEYGMPPAAGVGIGIDRVVMLFTDTKNIREVVFFPTLRPR